jgi:hypothetical protein
MMWGRIRLGYQGRVMVLKTMAFSTAFYLGTLWDAPKMHAAKIRAMTRYFFWKGRMPAGITAKSRAGAYKCGTPVADEWLAYPPNQGGFGLWSPMDHLTAMRSTPRNTQTPTHTRRPKSTHTHIVNDIKISK